MNISKVARKKELKLQELYSGYKGVDKDYVHAGISSLNKLWDWKFGIRVHWGIYSIPGVFKESWGLLDRHNGDPEFREQYEELHKTWNPIGFDANKWMDIFAEAGCKYFVFTTKHHDGFFNLLNLTFLWSNNTN